MCLRLRTPVMSNDSPSHVCSLVITCTALTLDTDTHTDTRTHGHTGSPSLRVRTHSCWCRWPLRRCPLAAEGCRHAAPSCLLLCICQRGAPPSSPSRSRRCSPRRRPGQTDGPAHSSAPPAGGSTTTAVTSQVQEFPSLAINKLPAVIR